MRLKNGTYLREPDGATLLYHSPYSFNDAAENFRKKDLYDDSWYQVVNPREQETLNEIAKLAPGEFVFIRGGEVV